MRNSTIRTAGVFVWDDLYWKNKGLGIISGTSFRGKIALLHMPMPTLNQGRLPVPVGYYLNKHVHVARSIPPHVTHMCVHVGWVVVMAPSVKGSYHALACSETEESFLIMATFVF